MSFVSIYRHVKCLKVFFFLKWGRGCRGGRRRVSQSAAKYTTAIALLGVISLKLINVGVLFRFLISDRGCERHVHRGSIWMSPLCDEIPSLPLC